MNRKIGMHIALTPTWNETAYFADYVLPMGHASERHDLVSYETHSGLWIGFRQPILREALQKTGQKRRIHLRSESRRSLGRRRILVRTFVAD